MNTFLLPPLQADFRKQIKAECSKLQKTTIFSTAFSPLDAFLVGVSSDGQVLIWDLNQDLSIDLGGGTPVMSESTKNKKRKFDESSYQKPCFQFKASDGALYDVQFIPTSNEDHYLLAVCGNDGIFLYDYDDLLSIIKGYNNGANNQIPIPKSHLSSCSKLRGPFITPEFNRISYDSSSGNLYGASGDGYGYIWDIATSKLLGTLGKNPIKQSSSDYLHTIKVIGADSNAPCHGCVLTGGEGKLSMWNGKDRALIDTFDCARTHARNSEKSNADSQHQCWVSSIALNDTGNWCTIGGGTSFSTARSKADGGFLQLFNIQNRIMSSSFKQTTEIIHDVAYDLSGTSILSVGNNCAISSWPSLNLSAGPSGRAWASSPSSYSISVHEKNGMVACGNVNSSVDCFTEYLAKTCTLSR